jgi:hypothetical protein
MAEKMMVQIDEREWEIINEAFNWEEYYNSSYDNLDIFPTAAAENVWLGDRLMMLRDIGRPDSDLLIEESNAHPSLFENQRFDLPQLGLEGLTFSEMVAKIVEYEDEFYKE